MSEATSGREILITRIFAVPRDRLFRAWTDPDELASWFGPAGMEVPRQHVRVDLRVGGRWELTMVRPGGGEFAIGYEILEVSEPELLVMRSDPMPEAGMPEPPVVRVEFHEHGPKTRMTLTDGPYPPAGREGAEVGWRGAFDKLEELVTR